MVNYSKWDKLELSDDEEDEPRRKPPRVQRFDGPQSVTIGKDGVEISPQEAGDADADMADLTQILDDADVDEPIEPTEDELAQTEDHREFVLNMKSMAQRALRDGFLTEGIRLLEKAMRIGGAACPGLPEMLASAKAQQAASEGRVDPDAPPPPRPARDQEEIFTNGGLVEGRYRWCQTKETLEVNVFVPAETKGKDVTVQVMETSVRIDVRDKAVLSGNWEYKVDPEEDPDWELKDCEGRRAVRLTVRKKSLPGNMSVVVWWRCVLKGDPAIDVEQIQDRKPESCEAFSRAWDAAHTQFKEKVKKHTPIEIDCSACGEAGAAAGAGGAAPMEL